MNQAHIIIPDLFQTIIRPAADDLNLTVIPRTGLYSGKIFTLRKEVLPGRIIPVQQETKLQLNLNLKKNMKKNMKKKPELQRK